MTQGYRGGTKQAGTSPCIDCKEKPNSHGSARCDDCTTKANRAKNQRHWASLPAERKERVKARIRERSYGITDEEYKALLEKQGGCCAVCKAKEAGGRAKGSWYVDHCHKTGKVRGLLCNRCNRALGMFEDDETLLRAATSYLEAAL